jgi:hypothetical protein
MTKYLIAAFFFLSANAAFAAPMAWYLPLQPAVNGPTTYVGPYNSYAVAADILGSMLYSHPFQCHLTGKPSDCRITGNGMAYPRGTPFPPVHQIPGSAPVRLAVGSVPTIKPGNYGLFYATDGTVTVYPQSWHKGIEAWVKAGKGITPEYSDMQCPNAPFFTVNLDPDGACE